LIILIIHGEEYKLRSSSLCNALQPPDIPPPSGPRILLSALFTGALSLCSSLNLRSQVSHQYKTTDKILLLHVLIFTCLHSRRKGERFLTEWQLALPEFNLF
jgi:hypothetical protein